MSGVDGSPDPGEPTGNGSRRRTLTRRALLSGGLSVAGLAGVGVWYATERPTDAPSAPPPTDTTTGRPDASNTGVVAGTKLESRDAVSVRGGDTLENLHIRGAVNIRGTGDISMVNCLVNGPVRNDTDNEGGTLYMQHCEVVGIVRVARVVAHRVHVHDANDLWTPYVSSELTDSYLVKPVRVGSLHPDCAQFNVGTHTIENSTLDARADYSTAEAARINSCVQITADQGECHVTLRGCSFRGGNYSVNLKDQDDAWLTVTDCEFDPDGRRYGALIGRPDRMQLSGNTDGGTTPLKPQLIGS